MIPGFIRKWFNGPDLDVFMTPPDPPKKPQTEKARRALVFLEQQANALEIEANIILRRKGRVTPDGTRN